MNRLKSNPAAAFGILIALVGIAALVWYFFFRGKKVQVGPGAAAGGEPVLEFEITGTKKVSKVNTTSEYAMRGYEYAAPPFLGDNVDFTVTLKTKSGWVDAGVTKVHLYRRKTVDNGTTVDLIGTANAPYKVRDTISDFGSFDIQLPGSELKADAVGPGGGYNTLILVPIKDDNSVFGTNNDVDNGGIASTRIDISQGDLNYKLEGVSSTTINWDISVPTDGTDSSFSAGPGVSTKNRYIIRELVGDNEVSLEPGTADNTWKFKVHPTDTSVSAYYITARAPPTPSGAQAPAVNQFKLSRVSTTDKDNRYRILSGGKLLTWEAPKPTGNSSGPFQLIDQLELTQEQADNTIVTITNAPTTPAATTPATAPAPKVYPPKPYPGTTDSRTVKRNSYEWTVSRTDADYGHGTYKMEIGDDDFSWPWHESGVVHDAEGLFDEGVSAIVGHSATYTGGPLGEYHSHKSHDQERVHWFHFYLPPTVKINLDKLRVVPRSIDASGAADMAAKWKIYGIDRSSGNPVQTQLLNKEDAVFTTTGPTDLIPTENTTAKFSEFMVEFTNRIDKFTVIQELLFYGTE